jgi:hypothetical protein
MKCSFTMWRSISTIHFASFTSHVGGNAASREIKGHTHVLENNVEVMINDLQASRSSKGQHFQKHRQPKKVKASLDPVQACSYALPCLTNPALTSLHHEEIYEKVQGDRRKADVG